MNAALLPSIQMLGFQKIATFGTRIDRNRAERIAYDVNTDDPASQALWQSTAPATYMWVVAGEERPVYVGKATEGMEKRAREHGGGFYETATERQKRETQSSVRQPRAGLAHAERIRALWKDKKVLELWVRPAGRLSLFQFEGSLVSVEEEILIQLFQPPWNRETLNKKVPARAASEFRRVKARPRRRNADRV